MEDFEDWYTSNLYDLTLKSGTNTAPKPVGFSSDDEEPESMMIQIHHTQPTRDIPITCYNSKENCYSESSTSEDNDCDILYIVENKEFFSYKSFLIKHSQYFREIVDSISSSKKNYRILLPKCVEKETFAQFLNILETENVNDIDMNKCQKLLWIADFLKCTSL